VTLGTRPTPAPDDRSAPFWEAAGHHVLCVAQCSVCSALTLPPDEVCPHCGSTQPEFVFTPVSGSGTVKSWTVVHRSFLPGFEVPFILVDVELSEQSDLRLIGRLLDDPDVELRIGAPVRVKFEDIAAGVAVPAFVLKDQS
jgi:uncharacterized protein